MIKLNSNTKSDSDRSVDSTLNERAVPSLHADASEPVRGLSRRETLLGLAAGGATLALSGSLLGCAQPVAEDAGESSINVLTFDATKAAPGMSTQYPFELPSLPFASNAIEAVVDQRTMEIHHGKHHNGYTNKLNAALESAPGLQGKSIFELLGAVGDLPDESRTAIRNNGGGYVNHALFWPLLAPGGANVPEGDLAAAIDQRYGSVDGLKEAFANEAKGLFGSGWAWLSVNPAGSLQLARYENQDTPLSFGLKPVLGIDVWEHAYYLKYQNRRAQYVDNFLDTVNWSQASANFGA